MTIKLSAAGKRFNRDWIFKNASLQFSPASYAITGPNGSGKSTLLQALGGMLQLSAGTIAYAEDAHHFLETPYQAIAYCAPYVEVIEEMTALEFLQFHQQFKPLMPGLDAAAALAAVQLAGAAHKQIRYYSSGMKQRIKLAQAIFSDTPVLLLDEPCTNLDAAGIHLYHALIETYSAGRIVVVCSNDPVEYRFCTHTLSILDYK